MEDVIIIGGGPAGSSAAIYAARAELKTVVLDKGLTSGALGMTDKVENYPGHPRVSGPELIEKMRRQAEDFGARFIETQVIGVDFSGEVKRVYTSEGQYEARAVIIATGSMGRASTVPGEEELVGRGVSYCATCDGAFFKGRTVAVVGQNEEAIKEGEFLTRFAEKVYFVIRGASLPVDPGPKVEVIPEATLTGINGREMVESITIRQGGVERDLPVDGVFIYLQGNRPVTGFLGNALPTTDYGCLIVNDRMETDIPGVYAAGDILCPEVKQAVIAAAEGCKAAMQAIRYLSGRERIRADWK